MVELKLAIRRFRRRPLAGGAAALTLALGIGAVTAAFATINEVVLRDLPVANQEELVTAWHLNPERGALRIPFRYSGYEVVRGGTGTLSQVAGVMAGGVRPRVVTAPDPYTLNLAGVGTDPSAADQLNLTFNWDLDDDGQFDDATTAHPLVRRFFVRLSILWAITSLVNASR